MNIIPFVDQTGNFRKGAHTEPEPKLEVEPEFGARHGVRAARTYSQSCEPEL